MDPFEEFLQENIDDEDPNTFEEFLELEEYIDFGHLFTTDRIFSSKDELVDWAKQTAKNGKIDLIITWYQRSRTLDRRPYGHAQAARLTEEQLQQTEQFRKSHVPPHNIKIYNVVAKIKRNRMQGRNTIEEVLCLSAERGYTVFHRNREDNNVLSDIVIAHPTSIAMIRTWAICTDNGYDV
ncbi:hypothetical protein M9H77_36858 [Catharanthus roseus]|uniref:Uncharacterized protein n=1 Tax=Catharanthus roseus TaxID=4058 RepID=A0ACB9ZTC0_CATRO|nr:hypothetical protein M9H77_36858 [Catharanthus roseus]